VRGLNGGSFASSSKDATARIWTHTGGNSYECARVLEAHEQTIEKGGVPGLHFIAAGRHPTLTAGAIITGGYDRLVMIWDVDGGNSPSLTLIGHQGAVVCFADTVEGDIISGSTDKCARQPLGLITKLLTSPFRAVPSVFGEAPNASKSLKDTSSLFGRSSLCLTAT
jgi:WD40 repeat protein